MPDPVWVKATASGTGNCVEVAWRKARASGMNGCVEIATASGAVMVRDSKDPGGPVLTFTAAAWLAFLDECASGRYDDLI